MVRTVENAAGPEAVTARVVLRWVGRDSLSSGQTMATLPKAHALKQVENCVNVLTWFHPSEPPAHENDRGAGFL